MGGDFSTLTASTKTELKEMVREWKRWAKGSGLDDIRLDWDTERVQEAEEGYSIQVWAHS